MKESRKNPVVRGVVAFLIFLLVLIFVLAIT
jgi:hypothetical protein